MMQENSCLLRREELWMPSLHQQVRAALVEDTKRAAYKAGHCWGQALVPSPVLPSPQEWGWTMNDGIWRPFWTTLPDVTKSCQELVQCGCKKGCQGRCSCTKAGLRCTALCTCTDDCDNTWLLFKLLMVAFFIKIDRVTVLCRWKMIFRR